MRRFLLLAAMMLAGIFTYSQNVGIGTTTPGSGFELKGSALGAQQRITDAVSGNSLVLQAGLGTNLKVTGYNYNTGIAQPLFLSVDGANTFINPGGGQVGIGTTTPVGGYLLNVAGPVKSTGNSTHFVAETNGGTNSWARLYLRSSAQSWFAGTSQNFNGNQLYIADETFGHTRLSIQPNLGPIYMTGNLTHNAGSYGTPRAMLQVNANGTIARCFNGVSGSTTGGCGFSLSKAGTGDFRIGFPFDVSQSFVAISVSATFYDMYSSSHQIFNTEIAVYISSKDQFVTKHNPTDLPFSIVVY